MSPRGAATLVVLLLVGLGSLAAWLVGTPGLVIGAAAVIVLSVALARIGKGVRREEKKSSE